MTIDIANETAARLAGEASRQGISVGALLERLINDIESKDRPVGPNTELPVWQLGPIGELHRRDIYDDDH